ncbi:unnamed protein product, partial [Ilex paraguariensis]
LSCMAKLQRVNIDPPKPKPIFEGSKSFRKSVILRRRLSKMQKSLPPRPRGFS